MLPFTQTGLALANAPFMQALIYFRYISLAARSLLDQLLSTRWLSCRFRSFRSLVKSSLFPGTALAQPWHSLGTALAQPWHSHIQ